jgi:hypothetical protein
MTLRARTTTRSSATTQTIASAAAPISFTRMDASAKFLGIGR